MKRFLIFLILFFLGSLEFASAAEPGDLETFLSNVEKKASRVTSFVCNFKQERRLAIFSKPVVFNGRLYLKRPGSLRWEFVSPVPSVLILNGSKGMRCSDGAEPQHFDFATNPVMKTVTGQIWSWIDGSYGELDRTYTIRLLDTASGIELVPKEEGFSKVIDTIQIIFEPDTLQPSSVEILEKGGDKTSISFHDYSINIPIDQAIFSQCRKSGE